IRLRGDRHGCRTGLSPAAAVPVPLPDARLRALRAAVSLEPGPAAGGGRGADLPAAQDREGQRQSAAGAGAGRSQLVSVAARAPAGGARAPRVAVVTGGSTGIGGAICEDLLAHGYEVVSLARRRCDIDHPRLHSVEVDLMDRQATAQAVTALAREFEVDTLVHNAGVIRPALLPEVDLS